MPEKFWLNSYPPQVPAEINKNTYSSLADLFEQTFDKFSQQVAVTNFGSHLTYGELAQLSRDFAAWLQQTAGLKKGDRMAIMLPNILQYYVAMLGALRAGLIVVNVNPLYTAAEVAHQVQDAGATAIVVMANFAHTLEAALPHTAIKQVIVTEVGDLFQFPKSVIFNSVAKYVKKGVPAWHIPQAMAFKKILAAGAKLPLQAIALNQADIAFLQYTGGTTGVAKGAVLTHGNIIANVEQALAWMKTSGLAEGKEVILVPLPLYHVFSLTVCAFCFLKLGANAVLITNPRDIANFMKVLAGIPYTVLVGINTLFNVLLQQPKFSQLSFKHLKLVVTGGMPLQKLVAEKWQQITGIAILEGYGLTEASPIVAINPTYKKTFTDSIGLPVPSTDVVLRDENNQDVAIGEAGELCVKGPQVMRGYWQNATETQQTFTVDGWLKTGDIARFDQDGFLYVVDRKKDMIVVSGFKVYPNEIEAIIATHPAVKEVAVIGVPNEASGEAVKAFVVSADANLTTAELIAFCKQRLTGYKIPHQIAFIDELPKSAVGKILRRELKNSKTN
jgi:long-chain acyl-CoA synthetase